MVELPNKLAAAAALTLLVGIGTAVSATEGTTIFDRLHALDSAATESVDRRAQLQADVSSRDTELESRWDSVDVALRAAKPIRRDIHRALGVWLGAFRQAEREALDGPVAPEDTHRLLRYAADDALPTSLRDVDVIRRADAEREGFSKLLQARSEATVSLALSDARAKTSTRLRKELVESARVDGASADLGTTRALLEDVLARLPDHDPSFDFHRSKGTLARPITADPNHRFGEQATLVRPNGLTYRPESGREIHATGAGEVAYVGTLKGWGRVLVLAHGGGYRSIYAHLGEVNVSRGDRVERADIIAAAGDSGSLDGVRTYYELQGRGKPVDPEPWIMRY